MFDYKLTPADWIKKIPAHWDCKFVKEIFNERKTRVSDKIFPPLSVSKAGVVPQLETAAKSDNGDNRKLVKVGDFVINSRSDRKGSSGISDYEGSVSLIYTVLQPIANVDTKFLHYLLRSVPFTEEYYRNGKGLVADLWTTNYDKFRNILLPVPPIDEQEKIVRYLDKKTAQISAFVESKKKQVELLDELKRAVISEAVTKNSPHWQKIRLKYIADNNVENLSEKINGDTAIKYIDIGSVTFDKGITKVQEFLFKDAPSRARRIVHEGDTIISTVRTYLKAIAYIEKNFEGHIASTGFAVLTPRENIFPKFLYYAVSSQSFIDTVEKLSFGVNYPAINDFILKNIKIPVPPIDEQKEIAAYLDEKCAKIDKLRAGLQDEIKFAEELKTRIISDVVTGKTDVRELI